jgi:hypothetical protein
MLNYTLFSQMLYKKTEQKKLKLIKSEKKTRKHDVDPH